MIIPTLQSKIENKALDRLHNDIQKMSEFLKYDYKDRKLLEGVQIKIPHKEGFIYPFLLQILDTEPIKEAIIEKNLPKYINEEINKIMNPQSDK